VLLIIRRDVVRARPFFARCAAFLRERGDGAANTGVVVVVIIVGDVGMEENAATTASPPPPIKLLQQHNKIINILERTMKTMPLSLCLRRVWCLLVTLYLRTKYRSLAGCCVMRTFRRCSQIDDAGCSRPSIG